MSKKYKIIGPTFCSDVCEAEYLGITYGRKHLYLGSHRNLSQLGTCHSDIVLSGRTLIFGDAWTVRSLSKSIAYGKNITDVATNIYKNVGFSNKLARFARS